MNWGRLSPAARMGSETSEVLTTVSNDAVEGENCVLPPIVLGTLAFGFEYSSGGARVGDCLDVVWSSGSCTLALGFGEGSSF